MYWPDEIRSPEGLAPPADITVRPQEVQMAASLMERLSEGFDLEALHDDYQVALDRLLAAKVAGQVPATEAATTAPPTDIVDLMAALQASIDARNAADAETKTRAKKGTAKKTATKKAAAKRGPKAG